MKTKNIFRMLLVAAALLLGANNVKADVDGQIWSGNITKDNPTTITNCFGNLTSTSVLRVYAELGNNYWQVQFSAGDGTTPDFNPWPGGKDWGSEWYLTKGGVPENFVNYDSSLNLSYFDLTCTRSTVTKLQSSGLKVKPGDWTTIKYLAIVGGSGTETPTTYSITIDNTIQHGTVSVSGNKTTGLEANETVTLVATPDTNYELGGWNVKDANNNVITVTNNQFSMPASNVTVSATFTQTSQQPQQTETVTATISSSTGYATFSNSSALNFSGVNGMKAYIATAVSNNQVTLTQVTGAVAANTGLIIMNNNGNSGSFNIPKVSSGTSYNNNLLVAGKGNRLELSNSYTDYVLIQDETDGKAKFAEVWSSSALPAIPVGYAYLHIPSSSAGARHRSLSIVFDNGTTGISYINNEPSENAIYNLRGQRVENPTKGLYIINGKKVVIK